MWNKQISHNFLVVLFLIVFFTPEANTQDTACRNRYSNRISAIAQWVVAGHYGMASDILETLEKEISVACPDSGLLADVFYLRGNISLLTDDPETALILYRVARKLAVSLGQCSRIDQNTGAAWFAMNDYGKARRYFTHALAELQSTGITAPRRQLDLYENLGSVCYEEGNLEAAAGWWDLSLACAANYFPSDTMIRSKLIHSAGLVLFSLRRWDSAAALFRIAAELNPNRQDPWHPFTALVIRNMAMTLIFAGSEGEAEQVLEAYDPYRGDPVFRTEILRLRAWIHFLEGSPSVADSILETGLQMSDDIMDRSLVQVAGLVRFRILRDRAAFRFLLREDPASVYNAQKQAISSLSACYSRYGALPAFILNHDSVNLLIERTLETGMELVKSGEVSANELYELISGVTDEQSLLSFPDRHISGPAEDQLQKEWLQLNRQLYRAERRTLQLTARSGMIDPKQETLLFTLKNRLDSLTDLPGVKVDPETRETGRINNLAPGEAILDYHSFPGKLFLFILRNDTICLARIGMSAGFCDTLVQFRSSLKTADDLLFRKICPAVSKHLLEPAAAMFKGVKRLRITTAGLNGIPFECLEYRDEETGHPVFVAEQFAVSYQRTSGAVTDSGPGAMNGSVPPANMPDCEFVGFSPSSSPEKFSDVLDHADDELDKINAMFAERGCRSKVFKGEESDETTFLTQVPSASVIHIATHARIDSDFPVRSGLKLWKESPPSTGDDLIDGILELGELRGMRLQCSLLTLSSCTLKGSRGSSDHDTHDPESFFLNAGARNVLSSLWNVSDRHTRTLMCDFYRFVLNGDDYAEALRKAKVKMLRNPATASPYLWASFILSTN